MERPGIIDLTKAQARARAVGTSINHEGAPRPTFVRASQNVAAAVALLETIPTPSTDGADKVYHQLKDILGVTAMQQAGARFSGGPSSRSQAQAAPRLADK
jgi:hypothetical protein